MMNYNPDSIILTVKDVTVTYNKYGSRIAALNTISLPDIKQGDWVFIVGSNGSGKSTLFKAISKQLNLNSGSIRIDSVNIENISFHQLSLLVFLVNQNPLASTIDELTVWENLLFAVPAASKSILIQTLKDSNLLEHKNHLAKNLSGGQRQILSLHIAKLKNVKVLLLDEPLAALDPSNRTMAMQLILDLNQKGMTVVFITHDENLITNPMIPQNKILIELNNGKLKN